MGCCGRGGGESSGRPGRDGRCAGVEVAGASHPSSVGSGSEADGLDASMETDLVRVAHESKRMGRSSHGRPDVRAPVLSYMEDDSMLEYDGICTTMVSN